MKHKIDIDRPQDYQFRDGRNVCKFEVNQDEPEDSVNRLEAYYNEFFYELMSIYGEYHKDDYSVNDVILKPNLWKPQEEKSMPNIKMSVNRDISNSSDEPIKVEFSLEEDNQGNIAVYAYFNGDKNYIGVFLNKEGKILLYKSFAVESSIFHTDDEGKILTK